MNLKPLSITSKRAEQLKKLISLDEQKLVAAHRSLSGSTKSLLRISDVLSLLQSQIGDGAEDVLKLILSLRRLGDDRRASSEEVFEALVAGLENFKWSKESLDQIRARRAPIVGLLSLELIHNTYKLADLYFGHDKHLHGSSIYTELRPVFNSARSSVEGYILYSSLRIVYSDRFENESMLTVSLKRDELEALQKECERALVKLGVMESELRKRPGQNIIEYSGRFTEHD